MTAPNQPRKWGDLFPGHPALWITLSAILVVALAARPRRSSNSGGSNDLISERPRPSPTTAPASSANRYAWLSKPSRRAYSPLAERLPPPGGFVRVQVAPNSFAEWLRGLPVMPPDAPVRNGNHKIVKPPDAPDLAAVIDLQPGHGNLLAAANIILRLRAEFLWSAAPHADIVFHFTSGDRFAWSDWAAGQRPIVSGRTVRWSRSGERDDSRTAFTGYLETLFRYGTIYSLIRDTNPVTDETIQAGDIFAVPGQPGHAVIVLDVATDAQHNVLALLGQGATPAQTFHVPRASSATAWFEIRPGSTVFVPPWGPLRVRQLRRW